MTPKKIQHYLSKFFSEEMVVTRIKKISKGPYSDSYKVDVLVNKSKKSLLIKRPSKYPPAFIKDIDFFQEYLTSQKATNLANMFPSVLGCFYVDENDNLVRLSPSNNKAGLFQIQEYREGEKYLNRLLAKASKKKFASKERLEIKEISGLLSKIHQIKPNFMKNNTKKACYKRALREVVTHPRLTLTLFSYELEKSRIFQSSFRYDYISEMIKVAEHFGRYYKRLSLIHGDFWSGNILLDKENKIFFTDYSNHCYGEPGMDIGNFYIELLWLSVFKKNTFYQQFANYFLEQYIKKTGDKMIKKTAVSYIGFTGAICSVKKFFPAVTDQERLKFAQYIYSCLRERRLLQNYGF
ncbi:MAG: phosphotransferase [Candidatus Beckwithbacteria bacterium]